MKEQAAKTLRDPGSERALLGTILKNGKNAFLDADGIVAASDFSLPINRAIYNALKSLTDDKTCEKFDSEVIKLKAKSLGYNDVFTNAKDLEYLEMLGSSAFDQENIPMFAMQIKKFSVVRDLYDRYLHATNYLTSLTGNESLSDIIQKAEGSIVDFITGADNTSLQAIHEGLMSYIDHLIDTPPVDQVGIPTGFPIWDEAIGGGPRKGTVSVIGARPKTGKSFDAINKARNIAKRGIPVLYLDTELTKSYQQGRLVCIESECPIALFETGKFNKDRELVSRVREAGKVLSNVPFYYESISGKSHTEALALVRRWLVKCVGFNAAGKANDCVIIYDYFKLTSGEGLKSFTPEYILLGLMLTELHNFAVKYEVPIIGYVQLNRDGINAEDTSVVAGSDRILWLCSSLSLLKNKDDNDTSMGCGYDFGNKKMVILETRQGSGLEVQNDYINLHASLRPNVGKMESTGLIREGYLYSKVSTGPQSNVKDAAKQNQPRENS